MDGVCKHMTRLGNLCKRFIYTIEFEDRSIYNNMKWTEELLRTESQKYNKKSDFKKYSRGAFEAALKKKILDDICPHMKSFIKWTEELLRKEALKYKTRIDFYENSSGYIAAKRRGILDEICTHMRKSKFTI